MYDQVAGRIKAYKDYAEQLISEAENRGNRKMGYRNKIERERAFKRCHNVGQQDQEANEEDSWEVNFGIQVAGMKTKITGVANEHKLAMQRDLMFDQS